MTIFFMPLSRLFAAFTASLIAAVFASEWISGEANAQAANLSNAPPARSQWDESNFSRVRLMLSAAADAARVDDAINGGVEIQLEEGWHTYWRVPGDAGVPPQFDFSGSQNVAGVSIGYPVPHRYDDGASISVIYENRVVFPLDVQPVDPALPVTLSLNLFYGACAEVCIPVKAARTVSLAPGDAPDPLARIAIAEFQQQLPKSPVAGFMISSVTREPDGLLIKADLPQADKVDLFAEAPADWFIGQPELVSRSNGGALFRLSLKGIPADAQVDGVINFLLVAGDQGVFAEKVRIKPAN